MGFGLKVPHCPAGRQLNLAKPSFGGPLVTIAAMGAVALRSSAEGGGNSVLNVTTIAGGWYFGSPQATRQATRKMIIAIAIAMVNAIVTVVFD